MSQIQSSQSKEVLRMKNVEGKSSPVKCLSQSSQSNHAEYNLLKEGCTQ